MQKHIFYHAGMCQCNVYALCCMMPLSDFVIRVSHVVNIVRGFALFMQLNFLINAN